MKANILQEMRLSDGAVESTVSVRPLDIANLLDECEQCLSAYGGLLDVDRETLEKRFGAETYGDLVDQWLMEHIGNEVAGGCDGSLACRPSFELIKRGYPEDDFVFKMTRFELPKGTLASIEPVTVGNAEEKVESRAIDERMSEVVATRAPLRDATCCRPIEHGDIVRCDVEIRKDGVAIPRLSRKDVRLRVDYSSMPESFIDEVVGMMPSETKEFVFLAPRPNASRDGEVDAYDATVTVACLCEREVPEVTDQWVARAFPGIRSVEELRAAIADSLQIGSEKMDEEVDDALIQRLDVELPEGLMPFVVKDMMREHRELLNDQGMSLLSYCRDQGITEQEYCEVVEKRAKRSVLRSIALDELFDQLHLTLTREDVDSVFESLGDVNKDLKRDFVLSGRMHLAEVEARRKKAHDWLVSTAIVR